MEVGLGLATNPNPNPEPEPTPTRCFAPLRGPNGVKRFKAAIVNYDYDLAAWRESVEGTKGYEEGVEILDKNGGADASLTPTRNPP